MSHDISQLLREVRHADAMHVAELFPRQQRSELLDAIISQDPQARTHADRRRLAARRSHSWPSARPRRARRRVLLSALGLLAATVAAALLVTSSAVQPQTAAGAIAFRTVPGGDIVATVTNPFAAESELKAAFAERGFHISLSLIPVSPSLVGTVVYTSDNGGGSTIQPLQRGRCLNGGGGCAIGVKIPAGFTGNGYITLGRTARTGETYESQASAFAPGEPLHCSGLLGEQVAAALATRQVDRLAVEWRVDASESSSATAVSRSRTVTVPPANYYIWDASMTAPGKVMIWAKPSPWPADATHGAQFNQDC